MGVFRQFDGGGLARVGKNSTAGSWPMVINNSEKFTDVKFQDNLGIAVTISGKIYKSADRGTSWTEVTPKQNTRLNSIAFAGSKILVVGDSAGMVISQDNGQSFQPRFIMQNGNTIMRVVFKSKAEAYAIQDRSIFKTTDGGRSWEKLTFIFPNRIYGLAVAGTSDVYVCGLNGDIYKSSNNGNSWVKQTTNSSGWLYDVQFTDNSTGYAVGSESSSSFKVVVLKTTNGGSTWTMLSMTVPNNSFFNRSYFADNNKGWVVGDKGLMASTIDGGANWNVSSLSPADDLYDISFSDNNKGYAVGLKGVMYKTTDGGNNWLRNTLDTNHLFSIDFVDSRNGWCVGDKNSLYRTTDGGLNWQAQSSSHNLDYRSIHFFDSITGIVGGSNGLIQLFTCYAEKPVAKDTLGFKSGDKLSNLAVSGSQLTWYNAAIGGNVVPNSTAVVDKTFYYVTQRIGACESDRRKVYTLLNANVGIADPESELFQLKYKGNSLIINKEVNATISMYDLTGKIVYSTQVKQSEINIDVVDFNSGVYIIQLNNANKTVTKKIFIE